MSGRSVNGVLHSLIGFGYANPIAACLIFVLLFISCLLGYMLFSRRRSARALPYMPDEIFIDPHLGHPAHAQVVMEMQRYPGGLKHASTQSGMKKLPSISDDDLENGSGGSFYSCAGGDTFVHNMGRSGSMKGGRGSAELKPLAPAPQPKPSRKKKPRQNQNLITSFGWLETGLRAIVDGQAARREPPAHEVVDCDTQEPCRPLFVVAGTCPNRMLFLPMQAVLYAARPSGEIDFWWVKPQAKNASALETNTLSRHGKGKFKNDPARSRPVFEPLAKKFSGSVSGDTEWGVDENHRAYVEETGPNGQRQRLLIYLVWIETWSRSDNTLAGKMCYERPASADAAAAEESRRFFARQYSMEGGEITLAPCVEEEPLPSMMPPVSFQEMC